MDINKITQEVEKLNLDKEQKSGILNLIDLKINNDMEKVLTKIEAVNNAINAKFDSVKSDIAILKWLVGGIGFSLLAAAIIALIRYFLRT